MGSQIGELGRRGGDICTMGGRVAFVEIILCSRGINIVVGWGRVEGFGR
jgi:hypothetical protein